MKAQSTCLMVRLRRLSGDDPMALLADDLFQRERRKIQYVKRVREVRRREDAFFFECETNEGNPVKLRLDLCAGDVFRLRMKTTSGNIPEHKTPMLIRERLEEVEYKLKEENGFLQIKTPKMTIQINKDCWGLSVHNAEGKLIFRELPAGETGLWKFVYPLGFSVGKGLECNVFETISLFPDEHFYGFGEKFSNLDKRGQRIISWTTDGLDNSTARTYKNIPFFMSTRGYGIFVNSSHEVVYDMGRQYYLSYTFLIKDGLMDYFFIHGPSFKHILNLYTELTGKPTVPPKWSFGLWMSRATYKNRSEMEKVSHELRKREIPCDVIHLDPAWLRENRWCDLEWNEETFPDPSEMIDKLRRNGFKLSLWIMPYVPKGSKIFEEGKKSGYFAMKKDGSVYDKRLETWEYSDVFFKDKGVVDFTNPEAVKWYKEKLRKLLRLGVSVFKTDFGESAPRDAFYYGGVSGEEIHNLYPLLYNKAVFEVVCEFWREGIVWGRSGYAGMQRYPVCWSGDPSSNFRTMVCTLMGGLSLGLSGVPFWSHDIGGYPGDPTPELYIRWAQFGLFCSHSRCHGITPREPWEFGEEALRIFRDYANLRYQLLPYIYSCAYVSSKTGWPMIRAMVLEYQEDPNCHDKYTQYMFGESFLVAPIFNEEEERIIYLPAGKWTDYWTKEEHEGPKSITYRAPLERLPLFVKADSIIPMGPKMNYLGEKPFDPITLDIYLYSRAEFTLHNDKEKVTFRGNRCPKEIIFEIGESTKNYILRFNRTPCPLRTIANGEELVRYSTHEEFKRATEGWWFDPSGMVMVKIPVKGKMFIVLRKY